MTFIFAYMAGLLFLYALFLHDMPEHQRAVRWLMRSSGVLIVLALATLTMGVIR